MSFDIVVAIFVAVFGLCFGSFYNVVILRGLSGESIAFPGSKCPKCDTPLKWWHNIPLMSFLLLRGKCAFCGCKISVQYPLVELITMLMFLGVYFKWGFGLKTLFICGIFSLFLITMVTDIKERVILTHHAYILAGVGLLYSVFGGVNAIYESLLGILVGIVVMEILARLGYLFAGQRAFGEGDSYIAAALGAIFGWQNVLIILLAGFVLQFVFSLPLFLWNFVKMGKGKLALELVLFLVLAFLMGFYREDLDSVIYTSGLLLLVLVALHLIRGILQSLKTPSNCTYLPYVPAMVVAAYVGVFLWF